MTNDINVKVVDIITDILVGSFGSVLARKWRTMESHF